MSDFSITDHLGNPLQGVKVGWTSASALFDYLKTEGYRKRSLNTKLRYGFNRISSRYERP